MEAIWIRCCQQSQCGDWVSLIIIFLQKVRGLKQGRAVTVEEVANALYQSFLWWQSGLVSVLLKHGPGLALSVCSLFSVTVLYVQSGPSRLASCQLPKGPFFTSSLEFSPPSSLPIHKLLGERIFSFFLNMYYLSAHQSHILFCFFKLSLKDLFTMPFTAGKREVIPQ